MINLIKYVAVATALNCVIGHVAMAMDKTDENFAVQGSSGQWQINSEWLPVKPGKKAYAVLLASNSDTKTYRICRSNSVDKVSTGTNLLVIQTDRGTLSGVLGASLDIGSCVITSAKELWLRYLGEKLPSTENSIKGRFSELDPVNLRSRHLVKLSDWSLSWEKNKTEDHSAVLVNNVEGNYQVCLDSIKTLPEILPKSQPRPAVIIQVNRAFLQDKNAQVKYLGSNCTNVQGAHISINPTQNTTSLDAFRATGSLYRIADETD